MMKQHLRTFACGLVVALTMIVSACGGRETMASKSAEAYREAQAKGAAPSDSTAMQDHSVHAAEGAAMDHSAHSSTGAHAGTQQTAHAAHGESPDHSAMQHHASTASRHAQHGSAAPRAHGAHQSSSASDPHVAHRTSAAQQSDAHAQHRAASTTTHADHRIAQPSHGTMQHGTPSPALLRVDAPSSSSEMAAVRPGATLQRDDFDVPAPVSVAEAARASSGGGHSDHGAAPAVDHSGHSAAQDAQSDATTYTCPMHPEVTSTTPGTCPKCGMTLIKKEEK